MLSGMLDRFEAIYSPIKSETVLLLERPDAHNIIQEKRAELALKLLLPLFLCVLLFAFYYLSMMAWQRAIMLFAVAGFSFFALWHLHRDKKSFPRWQNLIAFCLVILYFHILITGGHKNSGLVWLLTLAPPLFFVLGSKKAIYWYGIVLLITAGLFFVFPVQQIDHALMPTDIAVVKWRMLGVMSLIGLYTFVLESERSKLIYELVSQQDKMRNVAMLDQLTGLENRRTMVEKLGLQERRCEEQDEYYSLIMCDIDHFKHINDLYGHQVGDLVIVEVARSLKLQLREYDTVARWGGEEFLIVLPGTNLEGATEVANKLLQALDEVTIRHGDAEIRPSMSFGVAHADRDVRAYDCLRVADNRLYEAKRRGRHRVISGLED
jgi:diguanylate cyclase (GGDEF)-like protein